ncbi:hypothetical protein NPIL_283481 [Nephila pilipes]|uniref:Uncharacterized protein n=1 Tax=Nephila pilipes TaxID=299642 RepID=A0A8X6IL34_NEPPI|nr:hypothetical protein NPIL_283481 [Nephila pilipes]
MHCRQQEKGDYYFPKSSSFRSQGGKLQEGITTSITISRKLTLGWCQSHMFGKPPGILASQFGLNPRLRSLDYKDKRSPKNKELSSDDRL